MPCLTCHLHVIILNSDANIPFFLHLTLGTISSRLSVSMICEFLIKYITNSTSSQP